jgi:hypothetical protein
MSHKRIQDNNPRPSVPYHLCVYHEVKNPALESGALWKAMRGLAFTLPPRRIHPAINGVVFCGVLISNDSRSMDLMTRKDKCFQNPINSHSKKGTSINEHLYV